MQERAISVSGFGGPEVLQIRRYETPIPEADQVLVRTEACGVSAADLLLREGLHPERRRPPFDLGWAVVGRVMARGAGVQRVSIGDRVVSLTTLGGLATALCIPEGETVTVDDSIDAAKLSVLAFEGVVAWQMLHRATHVKAGDIVLIHGAGAVGDLAIQLAVAERCQVLATDTGDKLSRIRALGATALDYTEPNLWRSVRDIGGAHVVLESQGGSHLVRSHRVTRRGGTVVFFGLSGLLRDGHSRGWASFAEALGNVALMGLSLWPDGRRVLVYSVQARRRRYPADYREDLQTLVRRHVEGGLEVRIAERIGLEEIPRAHRQLGAGQVRGKVVVTFDDVAVP